MSLPDAPVADRPARRRRHAADRAADPAANRAADPNAAPVGAPLARHRVVAVLVTHDGARWLPEVLAGLASQQRPPDELVVVDTGSSDRTGQLLAGRPQPSRLVELPRHVGFGAAVAAAAATVPAAAGRPAPGPEAPPPAHVAEWLWLLHDDSAPAPDALLRLLEAAEAMPSAALLGPKLRGWYDRGQLLEVGVTVAASGRRETGLERRERDQGQRDGVHDVLAVSTAGMLVRRDVWDELGGLDPQLPLFRDDVDFGWRANLAGHRVVCVTDAVLYHAEAAAQERRRLAAVPDRPHLVDRRHALYLLLAHAPGRRLPWVAGRLLLATAVRALGYLVGKLPGLAWDEVRAGAWVCAHPLRLAAARRARRRTRALPPAAVRRLLAPPGVGLRLALEALAGAVTAGPATTETGGRHALDTGPTAEEVEDLDAGPGLVTRVLRHPGVLLAAGLLALTGVAGRHLLGGGRLVGGALFPAPDRVGELWASYLAGWHAVGLGSPTGAPPYLAVLGALGSVLLGRPGSAVSLVLLGAVPLAGLGGYVALGRVVRSRLLRAWGAVAYATLPPVTGAVATGRLGTAAVAALLPWAGLAAGRALRAPTGRPGDRAAAFAGAWAAGLALAVAAAFAPLAWPLGVLLAALALGWRGRRRRAGLLLLAALLAPAAALLPYSSLLVRRPALLLAEPGWPDPAVSLPRATPWEVLLLHPGGPGTGPVLLGAGLLLAALVALVRASRWRLVAGAWLVTGVGLATALVQTRLPAPAGLPGTPVAVPWPGPALLLAGAGLVVAAVVAGEGARERLARRSFGVTQPAALLVTAAAALVPVLAALSWTVRGAGDPLVRTGQGTLPAYVAAEGTGPDRARTLVVAPTGPGARTPSAAAAASGVGYTLLRDRGPRVGDAEVAGGAAAQEQLAAVVADLAGGRGTGVSDRLAGFGVRYVLLARPADPALARTFDAVPGLSRLSAPDGAAIWKVGGSAGFPAARLRLVAADGATTAVVPSTGPLATEATLPAAAGGERRLVLAERTDPGWRATVDGTPLVPVTVDGWAQGFVVPPGGGRLRLWYDAGPRHRWLWAQAGAVAVLALLALPARRRSQADEEGGEEPDAVPPDERLGASPGRRRRSR